MQAISCAFPGLRAKSLEAYVGATRYGNCINYFMDYPLQRAQLPCVIRSSTRG